MLSMIFAFSLVATTTVVVTILALCFVRGLLRISQSLSKVRAREDADPEDADEVELQPFRAIS